MLATGASVTLTPMDGGAGASERRLGEYRYGLVFLNTLGLCAAMLILPDADWALGFTLLLAGLNLMIILATSRDVARRQRGAALAALVVLVAVVAGGGGLAQSVATALIGILNVVAVPTTASGLLRLIRSRGVVTAAVFGALAIYLLIGLVFASVYAFLAAVGEEPLFGTSGEGTMADCVYFSFTAMTTTGFGDLAVVTRVGRTVVVLEMLLGQLYLVTVIALLISNLRRSGSR